MRAAKSLVQRPKFYWHPLRPLPAAEYRWIFEPAQHSRPTWSESPRAVGLEPMLASSEPYIGSADDVTVTVALVCNEGREIRWRARHHRAAKCAEPGADLLGHERLRDGPVQLRDDVGRRALWGADAKP